MQFPCIFGALRLRESQDFRTRAAVALLLTACGGDSFTGDDASFTDAGWDVANDAAADASSDAAPSEASSDAGTDTALDASPPCVAMIDASVFALCGTSATCVPPTGSPTCDPSLQPCGNVNDLFVFCGGDLNCGGSTTTHCCLSSAITVTSGACGAIAVDGGADVLCEYQCNAGKWGHQLCTNDAQCDAGVGGKCTPKFFSGFAALDAAVVGVCE